MTASGLGLAMAGGFAQQSRGRLEIDSEIGTGTTIRFLFPISRDTPGEDTADAASVAKAGADATGEHILAVEDSEEVLELAGAALLYGDGAITPAISVLSAVEGLKVDAPALRRSSRACSR